MTTDFSTTYFINTVSGSSAGEHAAWFFDRVRQLTTDYEAQLEAAIEFKTENVVAEIRAAAGGLAVLMVKLRELDDHCRNVPHLTTSLGNAKRRIASILAAHEGYIGAAHGEVAYDQDN